MGYRISLASFTRVGSEIGSIRGPRSGDRGCRIPLTQTGLLCPVTNFKSARNLPVEVPEKCI